jgi:hypothetical protein
MWELQHHIRQSSSSQHQLAPLVKEEISLINENFQAVCGYSDFCGDSDSENIKVYGFSNLYFKRQN